MSYSVVGAGEERAAVALDVVDVVPRREVARVVGELVLQQPDGDRVELDCVDVADAVGERGLDLVAAGRADDQDPLGLAAERGERDLAAVVVETCGGGSRPVVAPDRRPPQTVVVQDVQRTELDGVDPEHCTPVAGRHDVAVAQGLGVVGADVDGAGSEGRHERDDSETDDRWAPAGARARA